VRLRRERVSLRRALVPALCVLALAGAMIASWQGGLLASSSEPGSEQDPLVSRSYVDQYVQIQVVTLAPGRRLEAMSGGTEMILRAGTARAVSSPAGGLVDATAGRDLGGGATVPPNHLLIVPRADGRGVTAVTETILMVRGAYAVR
jgi:hypothetical protein